MGEKILIVEDEGRIVRTLRLYLEQAGFAVTAVQEKQTVHLSVIDSGSGIPPVELAYVFNRFWRSDKSRSRHSGGSGLGLAIVKQIAELHQGYVTAISPTNTGAIFTISLPMKA